MCKDSKWWATGEVIMDKQDLSRRFVSNILPVLHSSESLVPCRMGFLDMWCIDTLRKSHLLWTRVFPPDSYDLTQQTGLVSETCLFVPFMSKFLSCERYLLHGFQITARGFLQNLAKSCQNSRTVMILAKLCCNHTNSLSRFLTNWKKDKNKNERQGGEPITIYQWVSARKA